ncbi:nuclear transport factor 2 family protein [Amycolatopsis sp. WQ 127309]|uniref:nuclear transport factor 2 family protein n=1 Tax=Amycolatopsis sp. WQ 127309 TaxID=2932773 RepID=UPI001FF6B5B3|nr:nuclear transport factor 2 family protein [Amycolatopsis sp. WQ 127309]UOZ03449.1 nuclear transport factor 2 family protein [Amycolatopsis sp. WQ 127309]
MNQPNDRQEVLNAVHAYFCAADARDWDTYRRLHADRVEVDFGGVNDKSAGEIAADDMLRSARELLGPVHLTQHMIGNEVVTVDGDEATVAFYEQALHHHPALGDDPGINTWILYARGQHRWARADGGWRLVAASLIPVHHTGNADLLADVARAG